MLEWVGSFVILVVIYLVCLIRLKESRKKAIIIIALLLVCLWFFIGFAFEVPNFLQRAAVLNENGQVVDYNVGWQFEPFRHNPCYNIDVREAHIRCGQDHYGVIYQLLEDKENLTKYFSIFLDKEGLMKHISLFEIRYYFERQQAEICKDPFDKRPDKVKKIFSSAGYQVLALTHYVPISY